MKSLLEAYHRRLNRDTRPLRTPAIEYHPYQPKITESEPWLINPLVSSRTEIASARTL